MPHIRLSVFHKRTVVCFCLIVSLFIVGVLRLYLVATNEAYAEAANRQNSYSVTVYQRRGTIYDCNMNRLTDEKDEIYSVISPNPSGINAVRNHFSGEVLEKYLALLTKGSPILLQGKLEHTGSGVTEVSVPIRYSGTATHLIGYTDSTGSGVSGIEAGMNEELSGGEKVKVVFNRMADGTVPDGSPAQITVTDGNCHNVILTIDRRMQKIAENAMSQTEAGAVIIMDSKTGKIRAMVSCPTYDPYNLADTLDSDNSPFINRTLYCYNAGSVFKPFVAAAAIESGLDGYTCFCSGSSIIDGRTFRCHKSDGHGEMNLKSALEQSCNCYFYGLSDKIGGEYLYNYLSSYRIESKISIGGGLVANNGNITDVSDLSSSKSALANLSIGQGDLLISPVEMAQMYCSIANGGYFRKASIIEGVTDDDGNIVRTDKESASYVMKSETANILKEYLIGTVENGTGSIAKIDGATVGGKTGTAQTGILGEENNTSLNGWFCGFIEKGDKTYVITVMCENAVSGSKDSGPIFKEIAQSLFFLEEK